MKRNYLYTLMVYVTGAALVAFVPSCGGGSSNGIDGTTLDLADSGATPEPTNERICSKVMSGVTSDDLVAFIQPTEEITNIEPPVTFCLTASGTASTFRLEFEADAGIFYVKFNSSNSKVLIGSKTSNSLEVIFQDGFGLVGIKGNARTGTVRYYNFPTYDEAVAEAIAEVQRHCGKGGDWSVAKCNGYGPPTPWWNDPMYTSTDKLSKARALLNDASKSNVLGNVSY